MTNSESSLKPCQPSQTCQHHSSCPPASRTCDLAVSDAAAAIVCGPKVVIDHTPIVA